VRLAGLRLGRNTFIGNHAVVPCGQELPEDVLFGVCTVADERLARPGTSWFGQPAFELPRREVAACDRRLTHDPSWIRMVNRAFWEALRFALPVVPVLLALAWCRAVKAAEGWPLHWLLLAAVPLLVMAAGAALCVLVLALKWVLLGRVRPGTHPLWSCWCSRWDFLYVAWNMYARGPLGLLEGTAWLTWYLRAMGMRLGRRVVLGGGFAQVVDPDMIVIEDDATVSAAFQAHTFEDRVLKIDRVHVRRRATLAGGVVPLYGADIGEHAYVAPHSVIMKRERLLPGASYEGVPTRLQAEAATT
jgi:non-ribosomal peptide synthetase-like protein